MATEMITVRAEMIGELARDVRVVRAEVNALDRDLRKLGPAGAVAEGGLNRAERGGRSLRDMAMSGAVHVRNLGDALWGAIGTGAKYAALGLGVAAVAVTGFGLKSANSLQQTHISYNTLLGSVEAGNKMFADLQKLNLETPFDLNQVSNAARLLLQYGVAGNSIIPTTKAIADMASMSGPMAATNLERISLAVGQISAKGRLQSQEIRQLAEAGVPALQLVAHMYGVTTAQAQKMVEAGQVGSTAFLKALTSMEGPLAKFAGGSKAQMQSLAGQWSNFRDRLMVRLSDASSPFVKSLTGALPGLTDTVGNLVDTVAPPFMAMLTSLLGLVQKLLPIAGPVLAAMATGLGRIVDALGPSITEFGTQVPLIADAFAKLVTAAMPLVPVLGHLLIASAPLLVTVLELATAMLNVLVPVLVPLLDGFAHLVTSSAAVRDILAVVLIGILSFRAVSGIATAVKAFADVIGMLAGKMGLLAVAETEEAQARALGGVGGAGRLGTVGAIGGGVAGVGLAAQGILGNKGRPTLGGDLETVGGFAMAGGALGSVIPGAGTLAGAGVGALVGGVAVGAHHLFGGSSKPAAPATSSGGPVNVTVPVNVAAGVDASLFADPQFQTGMNAYIQGYINDRNSRGHA